MPNKPKNNKPSIEYVFNMCDNKRQLKAMLKTLDQSVTSSNKKAIEEWINGERPKRLFGIGSGRSY